jgi:hypothetical protein
MFHPFFKARAKAVLVLVVSEKAVFWVKHLVFERFF